MRPRYRVEALMASVKSVFIMEREDILWMVSRSLVRPEGYIPGVLSLIL